MSENILGDLKIPNVSYDFFVRLLPGITFISAIRVLVLSNWNPPGYPEMIIFAFAGYISGFMTQPASSLITTIIESNVGSLPKEERNGFDYISKIQDRLGESSRDALTLSKRHAEITFFVQLVVLLLILFIIERLMGTSLSPMIAFIERVVIILAILNAIAMARSLINRAQKLARRLSNPS